MRFFIPIIALVLMTACAGATNAPKIDGAPEVVVTTGAMSYSPTSIAFVAGAANLTLRNESDSDHDITIPDLGVHLIARSHETVTAGLHDLKPGRYEGYCSMLGHAEAGMRISVTVR